MSREKDPSSDNQNEYYRHEGISALEKIIGAAAVLGATAVGNLPAEIILGGGGTALIIHSFVGDIQRRRQ